MLEKAFGSHIIQLGVTALQLQPFHPVFQAKANAGFRIISISAHGAVDDFRCAVIWAKRPNSPAQYVIAGSGDLAITIPPLWPGYLSSAPPGKLEPPKWAWAKSGFLLKSAPKSFVPAVLTLKGTAHDAAIYAVVYEQRSAVPPDGIPIYGSASTAPEILFCPASRITEDRDNHVVEESNWPPLDLLRDPYDSNFNYYSPEMKSRWPRLVHAAGLLGDSSTGMIAALVRPQEKENLVYWNCSIDTNAVAFDDRRALLAEGHVRGASFDFDLTGRVVGVWHDDAIGPCRWPSFLTAAELAAFDTSEEWQKDDYAGMLPFRIAALGPADEDKAQYRVMFAKSDTRVSRNLTIVALPGNTVISQLPDTQPYQIAPDEHLYSQDPTDWATGRFGGDTSSLGTPLRPRVEERDLAIPGPIQPGIKLPGPLPSSVPPSLPNPPPYAPYGTPLQPKNVEAEAPVLDPSVLHANLPYRPLSDLDDWVVKRMKKQNVRGAQLAITRDTRLVFCRSYTWAEPDYPILKPTHALAVASVSKIITYVTLMRLIKAHPKSFAEINPLGTKIVDLNPNIEWGMFGVGYDQDGNPMEGPLPLSTANPWLYSITLRDLMRHTVPWKLGWSSLGPFQAHLAQTDNVAPILLANDPVGHSKMIWAANYYNQAIWPTNFWPISKPIEPWTLLAYLLSYAFIDPTEVTDYRNGDAILLGCLMEVVANPNIFPDQIAEFSPLQKEGYMTYPSTRSAEHLGDSAGEACIRGGRLAAGGRGRVARRRSPHGPGSGCARAPRGGGGDGDRVARRFGRRAAGGGPTRFASRASRQGGPRVRGAVHAHRSHVPNPLSVGVRALRAHGRSSQGPALDDVRGARSGDVHREDLLAAAAEA